MYVVIALVVGAGLGLLIGMLVKERSVQEQRSRAEQLNNDMAELKHDNREMSARIRTMESTVQRQRDLAVLFPELVKQILWARNPDEFAKMLTTALNRLTGCERIAVFLADKTGQRLGLVSAPGLEDRLQQPLSLQVGDGHIGFAAETGKLMTREDFEEQSALVKRQLEATALGDYIPDLVAPMTGQGVLYGVVCMNDVPAGDALARERLRAVSAIGAASLENIRLLERFVSAADLDGETGLPTASTLEDKLDSELERVRRFESPLSIVELRFPRAACDDRFLAREVMLMCVSHLKATMRNIDIGVRTRRDSVVLLLPGTDREGLQNVVTRLGSDMVELKNDTGECPGDILIRHFYVEAGSSMGSQGVLESLQSREFTRFEGAEEESGE
jgi:GGDEF domain-containing protein